MKTKSYLTAEDTKRILAASEAYAVEHGLKVVIAVMDDGGHLLGLIRLDGATIMTIEIAMGKARTAAWHRKPSKFWEDHVREGWQTILNMPFLLALQGGLPIMVEGECVGSVGVSGSTREQDEQIALTGIKAIGAETIQM
jgi:uncharacterized protein GlcG (DUF336 family)